MDFAHGSEVLTLLGRLNQSTAEAGGRVYLSKDSTLSAELMREMYPDLGSFMEVRNRVDPSTKNPFALRTDSICRLKYS